ncbi:hypothetical protein F4680DRAFT_445413 [Xylaria scruposa]|nr:hypothetical protein F4680DRAFT_445413 [Xylaria scruposa]
MTTHREKPPHGDVDDDDDAATLKTTGALPIASNSRAGSDLTTATGSNEVRCISTDYRRTWLSKIVVDLATAKPSRRAEKETSLSAAVWNPSTTAQDRLLSAIVKDLSIKQQVQGCKIVSPSGWLDRIQQIIAAVANDEGSNITATVADNTAFKIFGS